MRWVQVARRHRKKTIFVVVTASVVGVFQRKFKECVEVVGNPAQITAPNTIFWLRCAFGRSRSRWLGAVCEYHLPVAMRAPFYQLLAWWFEADLSETRYPLEAYHTMSDMFSRSLVEGARPTEDVPSGLVSPVDGEVLTMGVVDDGNARIEQVKGRTFSVKSFLGMDPTESSLPDCLFRYIVLYLPLNAYHRFHAPTKVKLDSGRHFAGECLPVRLSDRADDIFSVNERVVLSGNWLYGQFHLVAVAAFGVGNIVLNFDDKLKTNRMRDVTVHCGGDVSSKLYPRGVELEAGTEMGAFRMGSSVVLVLEAPNTFEWNVNVGDRVRVGEKLGDAQYAL